MPKSKIRRKVGEVSDVGLIPIMNLVCLLIPFLLYTAAFVQFACIHVASPRFQNRTAVTPPDDQEQEALNLMLVITDQGFRLAASGGVLPEGCGREGADSGASTSAPTVGLRPGAESCTGTNGYPGPVERQRRATLRLGPPACAYNFEQLSTCIARIHEEYTQESQIIISGESRIDYDVLIQSMDATRGTEESPHFPSVVLSSGVG